MAEKKTQQHFKCYLSKATIAYKEDPHWCSATGPPMVAGDHCLAELEVGKRSVYWACLRLLVSV